MFEKKSKTMKIKDICIEWGMPRNTINYLREKGLINPNGVISEDLIKKIK